MALFAHHSIFQPVFPGYLSFSLTQGIMLGLVFGAIFGSFEGIVVSSRTKAIKGLLFGPSRESFQARLVFLPDKRFFLGSLIPCSVPSNR